MASQDGPFTFQKYSMSVPVHKFVLTFCMSILPFHRAESSSPLARRSDLYQSNPMAFAWPQPQPQKKSRKQSLRKPDVIYYPTPNETVAGMLRLADIRMGDVLYDLGSGDGRIPIMAAQLYGIRTVGIEIDPKLILVAEEAARKASVSQLVQFRNEDMFRADISEASVVTLYLSDRLNLLLRPKLWRELRPGTRVLSHDFLMGNWQPEQMVRVPWETNLYRTIYLWKILPRGR
jgi:SAM-dependent methyltransferase